ncbi:MAG: hypothetical protein WC209_08445 [Ignavibacteriaceae bacterium]|jgi:hypothetical protein
MEKVKENISIWDLGLNSMYCESSRIYSLLNSRKFSKLIFIPIVSFALSFAQVLSDNYIPWWSGSIVGLIFGGLFGWLGVWILARIFYVLFWFSRKDIDKEIFWNIFYLSFSPLLFFSLTGLFLLLGGKYLEVSWYSGSPFMILGLLWSGFNFGRSLNTEGKIYFSSVVLSIIYLVTFLLLVSYIFPIAIKQINELITSISFLQNKIIINM